MTLRTRIILALAPILLLILALGASGLVLIDRLGGRIDQILRENYDSVRYMQELNEAVERIDSSFSFALAARSKSTASSSRVPWPRSLATSPFPANLRWPRH
jgi:hypothetical protein